MSKTLSLLLLSIVTLGTACADYATSDDRTRAAYTTCDTAATTDLDHVWVPEAGPHAPLPDSIDPLFPELAPAAPDDGESMCNCLDEVCVVDWVDTNFGCGVCASTTCGGELIGACVRCDDSLDAAIACIVADADTVALD